MNCGNNSYVGTSAPANPIANIYGENLMISSRGNRTGKHDSQTKYIFRVCNIVSITQIHQKWLQSLTSHQYCQRKINSMIN